MKALAGAILLTAVFAAVSTERLVTEGWAGVFLGVMVGFGFILCSVGIAEKD